MNKLKIFLLDRRDDVLDFRDDILDAWESIDANKRAMILASLGMIVVLIVVLGAYSASGGFKALRGEADATGSTNTYTGLNTGANTSIDKTTQLDVADMSALGYDATRVAKDSEIINNFCKRAFEFSDQDEYDSAWRYLQENYAGFDTWQIGREFMPKTSVNTAYSLSYVMSEAYVNSVEGDIYHYIVDVSVRVRATNTGVSTGHILLVCDTDGTGSFLSMSAYSTT